MEGLRGTQLLGEIEARYGEPFHCKGEPPKHFMNRKPGGECVFLESGEVDSRACELCSIHRDIGYQAKPTTCKNFPFIVVETPDDIRVGASFYCHAIQQNAGRPLSAHQDSLADFPPARRMSVGRNPVVLFDEHTTDWEGYKVLVDFIEAGASQGETYETRFIRALLGLSLAILKAPAGSGHVEAELIHSELERSHAELPSQTWFQMQMASCLHGTTLFLECNEPNESRALMTELFAGEQVKLPACHWEGSVDELMAFREQPLPEELQQELVRYLKSLIFRHYLGTRGAALQGLITLFLNSALIRQYSRLMAAVAGETLALRHLHAAFSMCEHDLMYHGAGFEKLWHSFARALLAQLDLDRDV